MRHRFDGNDNLLRLNSRQVGQPRRWFKLPALAPGPGRGPRSRPSSWCGRCTGTRRARRAPACRKTSSCVSERSVRGRSGSELWHTRAGGSGWWGWPWRRACASWPVRAGCDHRPRAWMLMTWAEAWCQALSGSLGDDWNLSEEVTVVNLLISATKESNFRQKLVSDTEQCK